MTVSFTTKRSKALTGGIAGTALLLALAAGAAARVGDAGAHAAPAVRASAAGIADAAPAPAPEPPTDAAADVAPPSTDPPAPKPTAAPATAASRRAPAPPPTAAPPAPAPATPAPAPAAKLPPGQRVEFTSAGVQAAAASLHQRIPLFAPTEAQLRTFADAVCTSFDQGQSAAQVQSTVRQAVSHIQGASLSQADAEFAVWTVVGLRCPGYLP